MIMQTDHEPGYDSFTALSAYEITPVSAAPDAVHVAVTYHVAGGVEQVIEHDSTVGLRLAPRDSVERVVLAVVRTSAGWRIESPQVDQHVLARTLLEDRALAPSSPADRS
ncbi:MAG TPA: hypothetical protein VJU82_07400 [Acidobacteriaceae bacterium]|nr:hypothetical protein [Acidobacteriaceae bacterium]